MLVFAGRKRTILALYIITFVLALYLALPAFLAGVPTPEEGKKPETAGIMFLAIIGATLFLLILIKFLPWLLRYIVLAIELFLLFPSTYILLSDLGELPAIIGAILMVYTRMVFSWRWVKNVSAMIIAAVTAAFLGVLLSPLVLTILLLILVLYDYVSVFVTRHMIKLARSILGEGKPAGVYALGLGDVVFPIALAVSLGRLSWWIPLFLIPLPPIAVYYALKTVEKTGKGVPALPPIAFSLFLGITLLLTVKLFLFP